MKKSTIAMLLVLTLLFVGCGGQTASNSEAVTSEVPTAEATTSEVVASEAETSEVTQVDPLEGEVLKTDYFELTYPSTFTLSENMMGDTIITADDEAFVLRATNAYNAFDSYVQTTEDNLNASGDYKRIDLEIDGNKAVRFESNSSLGADISYIIYYDDEGTSLFVNAYEPNMSSDEALFSDTRINAIVENMKVLND